MTPEAAAWVRDVVLTKAYRRNSTDPARCDCQAGICHHCKVGRHADCVVVAWGGAPRARPDTYMCDSRAMVAVAPGVRSVEVWRTGRPCRWWCPCTCCPRLPVPPPHGVPAVYQLDLFTSLPLGVS